MARIGGGLRLLQVPPVNGQLRPAHRVDQFPNPAGIDSSIFHGRRIHPFHVNLSRIGAGTAVRLVASRQPAFEEKLHLMSRFFKISKRVIRDDDLSHKEKTLDFDRGADFLLTLPDQSLNESLFLFLSAAGQGVPIAGDIPTLVEQNTALLDDDGLGRRSNPTHSPPPLVTVYGFENQNPA